MATVRQIVNSALRKLFVVTEGEPAAQAYHAQGALEALQGWYDQAMAGGLFGILEDVLIEEAYEAGEFERVTNNTDSDLDVTLPATVTHCGEERPPLDLAPVVVINPGEAPNNYIYDRQLGDWVSLSGLTLDSEAPLSERGRDGLASVLATRLVEHGEPRPWVVSAARAFLGTVLARGSAPPSPVERNAYF